MLGPAHAASGPLVFLGAAASIPIVKHAVESGNGEVSAIALISGMIIAAGFALVPDFDSKGTATNSLGVLGIGFMYLFRGASSAALMIRTRKDTTDDPHRSFTHTLIFSLLIYFILDFLCRQSYADTVTKVIIAFTAVIGSYGIFNKFMKKQKEQLGIYGVMIFALIASFAYLEYVIGDQINEIVQVVPIAAVLGLWAHFIGDIITTKGIPLLWPIPIRGRMWYSIRPLGALIEASDDIPNSIMYWGSLAGATALTGSLLLL